MPTRNNPLIFKYFFYGTRLLQSMQEQSQFEHRVLGARIVTVRPKRSLWQTGNLTLRHGHDTMSQGQIVCLVAVPAEDIVLHCRRTSISKLWLRWLAGPVRLTRLPELTHCLTIPVTEATAAVGSRFWYRHRHQIPNSLSSLTAGHLLRSAPDDSC